MSFLRHRRRGTPAMALAVFLSLCCGGLLGIIASASSASDPPQPASSAGSSDIPRPDPPFNGVSNRTLAGSKPAFPTPARALRRRAESTPGAGRRCRLRQPLDLRWALPDARALETCLRGPALQPVPRRGALLALARVAAFRAEPSCGRLRQHRRVRGRLARVQRNLAEERGEHRPDSPGQRLLHRRVRQVAPYAR